jgi:hypothetical protein
MPWIADYEPMDPEPEQQPYQPTEADKIREAELQKTAELLTGWLEARQFTRNPFPGFDADSYSKEIGSISLDVQMEKSGFMQVWLNANNDTPEGMRLIASRDLIAIELVVEKAEEFFSFLQQHVKP